MSTKKFFEETKEQSVVKATIVYKYFWAWARVIIPTVKKYGNKMAYIDLFAGPGRYKDGSNSTPVLILEKAIDNPDMRQMLVTIFNDVNKNNSGSLAKAIEEIPRIDSLKYAPQVDNIEIGDEISKVFEKMSLVPTLFFVDPWGYKGLSLRLINSVLKDWGSDCIFFFNYNRINAGLSNPPVKEHMDALFGEERANALRKRLNNLSPYEREMTIVEELVHALKDLGGKYVLPFSFKNDRGNRTSHHLIFVSKNSTGYEIMKEIMAKESSSANQNVPSFQYNPVDKRYKALFELCRPLDELEEMLVNDFSGQSLMMIQIYQKHNVDKPYIKKNYKDALRNLESKGKIIADPAAEKRKIIRGEITFGDKVLVSFPKKG